MEPEKLKKQGFVSNKKRETVQNWTWCCFGSFKSGSKTVFSNWLFQIWDEFSRYKFWKVSFSTVSCKHCCDTSFPGFSCSHQTLFHFNLLKDLQGTTTGVPFLEPPWTTWSPVLECFPCFVVHETLFFELFRFQKG